MRILRFIKNVIKNSICVVACMLIPKKEKEWVIGSWYSKRYSDNTRYLYEYLSQNKKIYDIEKITWITDSEEIYIFLKGMGLDVEKKYTLKGIWRSLRAKVHVIDQDYKCINGRLSYFAKRIQLWHGVGFKKLVDESECKGFAYNSRRYLEYFSIPGGWSRYCFLSTSTFATENIFKYSFRLDENDFIECNYPRNNILTGKFESNLDEKQRVLMDKINNVKGKKILYMPTYRGVPKFGESINERSMNLTQKEEKKLEEYLEKNDITIISKQHYANGKIENSRSSKIIQVEPDVDIYPLLQYTDMLITDYSSIYADYLFLNKPIIFYAYDLNEYKNRDKGFLFEYDDVTPGDKAFTFKELIVCIDKNLERDDYKKFREEIKIKFFDKDYEKKDMDYLVREILKRV